MARMILNGVFLGFGCISLMVGVYAFLRQIPAPGARVKSWTLLVVGVVWGLVGVLAIGYGLTGLLSK